MIKLLILLTFYIYNYKQTYGITSLFDKGFFETTSVIPTFTTVSWFETGPDYILLAPGKRITYMDNFQAGISIIAKRGDTTLYPGKLWNGLFAADYNALYL